MSELSWYFVKTVVMVLAIGALAAVVLYGMRRMGWGRPFGPVTVLGHVSLDARNAVYLVRIGSRVLVLGTGQAGMVNLGEIAPSDVDTAGGSPPASFRDALRRAGGNKGDAT